MKKLSTHEWVAVAAGIAFLTYIFFAGPLLNLFTPSMNTQDAQAQTSGVASKDMTVGNGDIAEPGDVVTAHYVGRLEDGRVFDSSRDRGTPISFTLGAGQVIKGWDEGLQGMRVGGTRTLVIPPEYGYGANAVGPIPANSTLIFEVELVAVKKGQ
jgi:peptidylprolyl isomerase